MSKKDLIIAGHGRQKNGTFDPGASGIITKGEHKYVVEDLFPAMKRHLPKNHNIVFFSDHKVSNYGDLVSLAKKYNAKTVTEIHFDAATASARGGHVIVYKGFSPDKLDLALRDVIESMVGVRYSHKGHKGISGRDNLYNVNVAANNGVNYRLTELGFGTNKTDADVLVNQVDEYAKRLVKAITGNVASKPKPNKPSKPATDHTKPTKSISAMVDEVIAGKHGSGHANRRKSLGISDAQYQKVRAEVNKRLEGKRESPVASIPIKSVSQMASEVIAGKHGSGHANRRKSLGVNQSTYEKVRAEVNRRSGVKTTSKPKNTPNIKQLADKIINSSSAPQGNEARRKWLGVSKATYDKVRAEINRRYS